MKKKIIIIDGVPTLNQLLEYELRNEGHKVEIIESSDNAVAYLQRIEVDLVIVKLYPSIVKGLEFIRKIGNTVSRGMHFLIVISDYDETLIQAINDIGFYEYLVMSFRSGELSFRVNRLLSQIQVTRSP